jgi:hypothetical protein
VRRVLGMQVERKPRHGGAVPALEPLGRGLAESAERSDVVGPDSDGQGFHPFPCFLTPSPLSERLRRLDLPGRDIATAFEAYSRGHNGHTCWSSGFARVRWRSHDLLQIATFSELERMARTFALTCRAEGRGFESHHPLFRVKYPCTFRVEA